MRGIEFEMIGGGGGHEGQSVEGHPCILVVQPEIGIHSVINHYYYTFLEERKARKRKWKGRRKEEKRRRKAE